MDIKLAKNSVNMRVLTMHRTGPRLDCIKFLCNDHVPDVIKIKPINHG